jgi:tetratricopeptide (TPR) repeat protein
VVEAKERIYGREHPETLDSANGLANLLSVLGRYDEAEAIFLRTLGGLRVSLGENHPKTISCMNSLGRVYLRQRRYAEAEPLLVDALARTRARFGELDERTSTGMGSLAQLYEAQHRFDEAEPLAVRVAEIVAALFGENSVKSLVARNNLAQVYQRQGKLELAEPMQASVIATARTALPEGHWHLGTYLLSYGIILRKMERYAECEPVLLEAHAVLLAALGPDHNRTRSAADQTAKLYEAWGREEDAAGWWVKSGGKPETEPG